jgi:hypothetical protein
MSPSSSSRLHPGLLRCANRWTQPFEIWIFRMLFDFNSRERPLSQMSGPQ